MSARESRSVPMCRRRTLSCSSCTSGCAIPQPMPLPQVPVGVLCLSNVCLLSRIIIRVFPASNLSPPHLIALSPHHLIAYLGSPNRGKSPYFWSEFHISHLVPRLRNSFGDMPVCVLKYLRKVNCSGKPNCSATDLTCTPFSCKRRLALFIVTRVIISIGVMPSRSDTIEEKYRCDNPAWSA